MSITIERLIYHLFMEQRNIYDFTVKDNKGNDVAMSQYKGKVLLIVNTATGCGFTPQYNDLDELYDKYAERGFEILDFPCNQFGSQAPGSDEEIHNFCTLRYDTKFPRFKKIDVNGENALPLYSWLKEYGDIKRFDKKHPFMSLIVMLMEKVNKNHRQDNDIRWNFTKFLIDREGNVVSRFEPTANKEVLDPAIKELLK